MAHRYVVDTNAVSDMMDGTEAVRRLIVGAELYVPVIVLGEVYFAYENSSRKQSNYERFAALSREWIILDVKSSTAQTYAAVQLGLSRKGRMIPLNDLWIAAIAIENGLPLLTRDAHFHAIDNLTVTSWVR